MAPRSQVEAGARTSRGGLEVGQGLAQLGGDRRAELVGALAPESQRGARRPHRQRVLDRAIEVGAHPHRQVAAGQADALEPGGEQPTADEVGVDHRERPRAGAVVRGLRLEVPGDDELGPPGPAVVLLAPPDRGAEATARRHRGADVRECRDRIGEEHDPHPREDVVVGTAEVGDLGVGDDEAGVGDSGLLGLARGGLEERRRDVDADRLALGPDQLGQAPGRVAEAAADVENAVSGARWAQVDRGVAVGAEALGDDVAIGQEALEERPVPGLDRLRVGRRRLVAHGRSAYPGRVEVSGPGLSRVEAGHLGPGAIGGEDWSTAPCGNREAGAIPK